MASDIQCSSKKSLRENLTLLVLWFPEIDWNRFDSSDTFGWRQSFETVSSGIEEFVLRCIAIYFTSLLFSMKFWCIYSDTLTAVFIRPIKNAFEITTKLELIFRNTMFYNFRLFQRDAKLCLVLLISLSNLHLNYSEIGSKSLIGKNSLKFVAIVSQADINWRRYSNSTIFHARFIDTATVLQLHHIPMTRTQTIIGQVDIMHYHEKVHFNCSTWERIWGRDIKNYCRQTATTLKKTCKS